MTFNLFVLVCLTLKISAQNTVKLAGRIDTAIMNKYNAQELTVRAKENASKDNEGITYKVPVTANGNFKTEISIDDNIVYLAFEIMDNRISNSKGSVYNVSEPERSNSLSEIYLFERGDSVRVEIKRNKVIRFSGKGSQKLNCQYQVYNIPLSSKSIADRVLMLKNERFVKQATILETEDLKNQIQQRVLIVNSYQTTLSPLIYKLLYIDAVSGLIQQAYSRLANYNVIYPNSNSRLIIQDYFALIEKFDQLGSLIDDDIKVKSGYYLIKILEKEFINALLNSKTQNEFPFEEIYDSILKKYSGVIREKLILLCYENYAVKNSEKAKLLYPNGLGTLISEQSKVELSRLMERYNTSAFPFTFYDENDKPHNLKDFKDKLIIMDFWFTSCAACIMVADAMRPIYEKYKNYNDVAFITVSTDLKEKWLESLKTEKYSLKDMTNLYTRGKGFDDPMINYYKFKSFPQQLIISKNGQLITASPPRPDESKENVIAFIKLIEDNL